jgi:hypothetical protein
MNRRTLTMTNFAELDAHNYQAAGQPVLRRFRNRVISGPFGELDRIAARPDALSKEAR